MIDDGGPAFPASKDICLHSLGMTLRDYFMAHAPAQEIADMVGDPTKQWCADYLGIPVEQYDGPLHWPQVLAKARRIWADAMLKERAK